MIVPIMLLFVALAGAAEGPVIRDLVNAADGSHTLAPGSTLMIRGSGLAAAGSATVEFRDGAKTIVAPLDSVSAGYIRTQLPVDLTGNSVEGMVRMADGTSAAFRIAVVPLAPRVLHRDGEAVALSACPTKTLQMLAPQRWGRRFRLPGAVVFPGLSPGRHKRQRCRLLSRSDLPAKTPRHCGKFCGTSDEPNCTLLRSRRGCIGRLPIYIFNYLTLPKCSH